jgi:hypothetical protein
MIFARRGNGCAKRQMLRRAACLRLAPLDHVLAENLLLLRASETKISRAVCLPGTEARSSPGAASRSGLEIETLPPDPDHTSGRGRAADHRLASRSVHALERTLKTGCLEIDSRGDADSGTKTQEHSATGKGSAKGRTGFETRSVEAAGRRSQGVSWIPTRFGGTANGRIARH